MAERGVMDNDGTWQSVDRSGVLPLGQDVEGLRIASDIKTSV